MMSNGTAEKCKGSNVTIDDSLVAQQECSTNIDKDDIASALQRLASKLEVSSSSEPTLTVNGHGNNTADTTPLETNGRLALKQGGVLTTAATKRHVDTFSSNVSQLSSTTVCREGDTKLQKQAFENPSSSSLAFLPGFGGEKGDESIEESRFESCKDCDRGITLLEVDQSTLSLATNAGILPVLSFGEEPDTISNQCETPKCAQTIPTTSIGTIPYTDKSIPLPMKHFKAIENALGNVSLEQKEIILQPPQLLKLAFTPPVPPSEVVLEDNADQYETPPPSYNESVFKQSAPCYMNMPAPSYASAPSYALAPSYAVAPSYAHVPTANDTKKASQINSPKKDSHISIIRLSNPPARAQFTRFANTPSQNALIWHSSGDVLTRDTSDPYSDHQLLALLACIMFWPIGLLAIYYANMAGILKSEGVNRKAVEYSKRALGLSLVSFIVGTGVYATFYFRR